MQYTNSQAQRAANSAVLREAKTFSQDWDGIQNSGESERTLISNLQMLTEGKYFWRDLMSEVIGVLPAPQPGLQDAIQRGDVAAIKVIPRGERRLIRVDEFTQTYDPKLVHNLADPNYRLGEGVAAITGQQPAMNAPPGDPPTASPEVTANKGRGFVVLLKFTCPLTNATQFVEQEVIKALMAIQPDARRPNLKYAVRRVRYINGEQIYKSPVLMGRLQSEYDAAQRARGGIITPGVNPPPVPVGGMGGGGFAPGRAGEPDYDGPGGGGMFGNGPGGGFGGFGGGPGGPPPRPTDQSIANNPANKDRITGESVLSDWQFTLAIAVEVDPDSWKKPEASPDASITAAQ